MDTKKEILNRIQELELPTKARILWRRADLEKELRRLETVVIDRRKSLEANQGRLSHERAHLRVVGFDGDLLGMTYGAGDVTRYQSALARITQSLSGRIIPLFRALSSFIHLGKSAGVVLALLRAKERGERLEDGTEIDEAVVNRMVLILLERISVEAERHVSLSGEDPWDIIAMEVTVRESLHRAQTQEEEKE